MNKLFIVLGFVVVVVLVGCLKEKVFEIGVMIGEYFENVVE